MNTTTDLPRIPLAKLHLSPLNARKTRTGDVDDLAASIAAHGLLQNLTVTVNDNPGEFEVVAGGRRLAAMQQLDREGRLPDALRAGVPCLVIENNDVAHEASTAENTLREAMHPADEYEAFSRMVEAGKPVADIAVHFGVEETRVKQRLKLARVAPEFLQRFREGGMELSQLQALTVSDDHAAQRAVMEHLGDRAAAFRIRQALVGEKAVPSDSEIVKFVGLEAYEAAGGVVRRDLFGEKCWCEDAALLDKLAMDALEAKAQQLRDAGWSWAEPKLSLEYDERAEYDSLRRPSDAEDVLPPELEARPQAINARIEEIDSSEDDEFWDERSDLEDQADAISAAAVERWPAELMAKSGCLVTINAVQGMPLIYFGRLQPGQKANKSGDIAGAPQQSAASQKTGAAQKAVLSRTVHMVLSAHSNEAVRYHVARKPELAMALLIDQLIAGVKGDHSSADVLRLNMISIRKATNIAPDVSKALQRTDDLPEAASAVKIPKTGRLAFLLKQPLSTLQAMLAYLVAQTFDGMSEEPARTQSISLLRDAIGIDMANHWNPTCDGFLGRIHADLVAEAVTEAVGKDAAATLKGLKKDERIATAAKLLAGTGWLPKPLRGPGYALKTAAPAKPAAAKKAAKKAG